MREKRHTAKTQDPSCDLVKDHSRQTEYVKLIIESIILASQTE